MSSNKADYPAQNSDYSNLEYPNSTNYPNSANYPSPIYPTSGTGQYFEVGNGAVKTMGRIY
jgi:hypothetical protein